MCVSELASCSVCLLQRFHIHTYKGIRYTPLIYRRDLCNCTQPLYWINQNRCLRCESNLLYVHGCHPPLLLENRIESLYIVRKPILRYWRTWKKLLYSPPIEDGRGFSHLNRRNERSLKLQRFFYKTNSREFSFSLSFFFHRHTRGKNFLGKSGISERNSNFNSIRW